MPCPHLCFRPTIVPINGGRKEGRKEGQIDGGRSVNDDEFGSKHVEFEVIIDVQKVL